MEYGIGAFSRYGRMRKPSVARDFIRLSLNGNWLDDTQRTPKPTPKKVSSCARKNCPEDEIPDDVSNEENMPESESASEAQDYLTPPLEEQMFVDSELFRPDKPEIRTYKKKCHSLPLSQFTRNVPAACSPTSTVVHSEDFEADCKNLRPKQPTKITRSCTRTSELKEENEVAETMDEQLKHEPVDDCEFSIPGVCDVTIEPTEEIKTDSNSMKTEDDALDITEQLSTETAPDVCYYPGDLVWARMTHKSPFWPCMITVSSDDVYYRDVGTKKCSYHVTFYGTKSLNLYTWTYASNLKPYNGSHEYAGVKTFTSALGQSMADAQVTWTREERLAWLANEVRQKLAQREINKQGTYKRHKEKQQARRSNRVREKEETKKIKIEKSPTGKGSKRTLSDVSEAGEPPLKIQKSLNSVFKTARYKAEFMAYYTNTRNEYKKTFPEYTETRLSYAAFRTWSTLEENAEKVVKKKKQSLLSRVPKVKVCKVCFVADNLITCAKCKQNFHPKCEKRGVKNEKMMSNEHEENLLQVKFSDTESVTLNEEAEALCYDCKSRLSDCFVCGQIQDDEKLLSCEAKNCLTKCHPSCCKEITQVRIKSKETIVCGAHTCASCVANDQQLLNVHIPADKLLRCVLCPTAYHTGDHCIPASAHILSNTQLVCPKHKDVLETRKKLPGFSATWCFICLGGGTLVVCKTCPITFHPSCINRTYDSVNNQCEECLSGRFITYGEIVWVKMAHYRFWPAQVMFPYQVEDLPVSRVRVNLNEFIVRFFGTHDYAVTNNLRAFGYMVGDAAASRKLGEKSALDRKFMLALDEVEVAFNEVQEKVLARKKTQKLKPPKYAALKNNKIVNQSVKAKMLEIVKGFPSDKCKCTNLDDNPCGYGSGCLNRDLCIECGIDCDAGEKCENRMFSKYQYAKVKAVHTERCGWGLVALNDVKEGDFIMEYVGEVIDEAELHARLKSMQAEREANFYFLALEGQLYIDAYARGNEARFMNHSCSPNCKADKWLVKNELHMGLFALKDIPQGTELTFDYHLQSYGESGQVCHCNAPNCSGIIGGRKKTPQQTPDAPKKMPKISLKKKKPKKSSKTEM